MALRRRPEAPDSLVRTISRVSFMSNTAAARMSAAIAARVTEPSPPKQRSSAPRSNVLPAPVSPVMTLKPGPNSNRASPITPKPWAYSSNRVDLGMSLSKTLVESGRQVETARRDDPHRRGALANLDVLARSQRSDVAAVGDDDGWLVLGRQSDHLVDADDDGPVDREVRRHWRQDHHRQRRLHDWTSRREVVTGAAGRRRHHDAVRGVREVLVVVDEGLQPHHVAGLRAFDDYFIECEF